MRRLMNKQNDARGDCMTSGLIAAQDEVGTGLSDKEIAWLSGSIFGAGAEV